MSLVTCVARAASTVAHAHHSQLSRIPLIVQRVQPQCFTRTRVAEEFITESGAVLRDVDIVWEQWGDPSHSASRTVLLLPGFSVGSHAHSARHDMSPGWWEAMIGPGRPIDTNVWRVICPSPLGSPFGSTSPLTVNPLTGKQYRLQFPQITVLDQARCYKLMLDQIGVPLVHAVIGSSVGGMQALQFAAEFPEKLSRLAVFCATGQTSPYTVGLRRVQRQAILADEHFHGGDYADYGTLPAAGLRVAREIGMLTYKCRDEYDASGIQRFDSPTFEIESYLQYQGNKFVSRYDPNCYLYMSRCAELMDIGRAYGGSYEAGAGRISAQTLLIAVEEDVLIHLSEMQRLKAHIPNSRLEVLSSPDGHDAFLTDIEYFGARLQSLLEEGLKHQLAAEAFHTTGLSSP